jgi:hypothetical protein
MPFRSAPVPALPRRLRDARAAAIVRRCRRPEPPLKSICRLAPLMLFLLAFQAAAAGAGCGSQAAVPADKRLSNTAHWTTASEEENFGYDVFRAESEQGPFVKLTKEPMLGNGTTSETHKYQYVDDSIDPCKEYWYYVESISSDGTREKFTPVFHAPAKRHADEARPAGKPAAK